MTDKSSATRRGRGSKILKSSLILAASALALGLATQAAYAQDGAAPADDTVVVVTSQRKAIQSAQQIKKKNDQIVDSTVAADVGKLPDNNVAEALGRVTGIQIRRDSGEANSVLIRGLPDLATTLNGRELFTTTGRYVQLADIPSTMLQRVDVYKTQRADQADGGLAGLIDVVTNKPFDFKGQELSVNARATYSDKSKKTDPNLGVMASNRWQTSHGEFGLLGGISYQERNFHEERAFDNEPQDKSFASPNGGIMTGPDLVGLIPIKGDRKRTAGNFSAQWRPDANSEYFLDGFYTRDQNDYELDFFVGLPWWGTINSASKIPGTNQLQTLKSSNVNTIMSTQANSIDSQTQQYTVGGKWRLSPQVTASSELSTTRSTFNWRNPILDTITQVPTALVTTNLNGTLHVEYSGENLLDPANYYMKGFFDRYGKDKGGSIDWRGDLTWVPSTEGLFKELKIGARYVDRSADSIKSIEGNAEAPDINTNPFPFSRQKTTTIPGLMCAAEPMDSHGPNYGLYQWATPCASFLLNNTDVVRKAVTGTTAAKALDPGSYFSDIEKTTAVYVQAKFGFDMGTIPVDGTAGLRAVQTEQHLKGNALLNSVFIPVNRDNKNTDYLPSLALRFTLAPDLIARFSAATSITRPTFAQLNPGVSLTDPSTTIVFGTGNGGNPFLKSEKSNNYDATMEWYFAPAGSVTAAAFYKKFDSYIVPGTSIQTLGTKQYKVTSPTNTGAGHLDGMEIAYQQFYDNLPGVFSGLGLQANVTFMEGEALYSDYAADYITPITKNKSLSGLSKWAYNVVLLYEKNGWTGRLAYNWRSGFPDVYQIVNLPVNAPDPITHAPDAFRDIKQMDLYARESSQLDGYLGYQLNSKVTLTLEGTNLTDSRYKDYRTNRVTKDKNLYIRDTRRYDRTIEFGVRVKM